MSHHAFQKGDLFGSEVEEVVDDAVDLGFGLGNFGGEAGDGLDGVLGVDA